MGYLAVLSMMLLFRKKCLICLPSAFYGEFHLIESRSSKIFAFYHLKGFLKNYLKEDLRHFMYFFKNSNLKMQKTYLFSYFSLLFQLPELLLARAKIQKSRNENISDEDILNLAPHYPPLLDEISAPILSIESIRNIYYWELRKRG